MGGTALLWILGVFLVVPWREGRLLALRLSELQMIGVSLVIGLAVTWGALHLFALADRAENPRLYATIRAALIVASIAAVIGGSVISQVRFGEKVYSPIISDGTSDLLISFERLEALRWCHLLTAGGKVLINNMNMTPITVSSGQQPAIEDLDARLKAEYPSAIYIDALGIAKSLGNTRAMNMVIAGALSTLTPFEVAVWEQAMRERIPAKLLDMNVQAFEAGRAAAG